jgi:hypothetical protein
MSGLELYIVLLPIVVGILGIQFELHKIRKLLEKNEEVKSKMDTIYRR